MAKSHNDRSDSPRRGIKAHGGASIHELREFVSQMRGKPPQEVLGTIAQSGLARGLVTATLIIFLVIIVGTALPFAWNKISGTAGNTAQAVNKSAEKQPDVPAAKIGSAESADPQPEKTKPDPKEAILDKLGIGETKTPPKKGVNPLEGRADDILKDLNKR